MRAVLDRLLSTLEVKLEAFALLKVRRGFALAFDPLDVTIVHYVLSGHGWLETTGGDLVPCQAGSLVILPAGMRQTLRVNEGPATEVKAGEHCAMVHDGLVRFDATGGTGVADLELLCGALMPTAAGSFGLFDGLKKPLAEPFDDSAIVAQAFEVLRQEVAEPDLGARAMASALMKFCLVLLVRRHLHRLASESPLVSSLQDERLTRAVRRVLHAPADPHTVAELAREAGMSRSAFAQAFSKAFDCSPMEFVAKTRLHHAAELLRTSDLPVKVVAASIGFASRSHFTRAFRKAYGQDPRSFRNRTGSPADAPDRLYGDREDFELAAEPDRS